MSSFLVWTVPAAGHVNPGLPIVRRLVERGHDVRWYTGTEFRPAIEATGARFLPCAGDPAGASLNELFPARAGLEGLTGLKFDLKHVFLDSAPAQIADLRSLLEREPVDALMVDVGTVGAPMLAALGGPPWAAFGVSVLTLGGPDVAPFGTGLSPGRSLAQRLRNRLLSTVTSLLFADVFRHEAGIRRQLGIGPRTGPFLESTISPYLYLQSSTPAFEYPRRDLPPSVHWIGPLLPSAPSRPLPSWWPDLTEDGRPVVLVTQGTIATDDSELMRPALEALADEPVLVVAAGALDLPAAAVPANARVAPFVPFGELLPHVSAMVTNGGFGGVQFALANGVPLVVAGTTEDKPEVAARVEWAGAGLRLRTRRPSALQIRDGVRRLLDDPAYAAAARRIADDYARHDAPAEAVALLEQLATTGRPVTRTTGPVGSAGEAG